jgi:hypothetical protein
MKKIITFILISFCLTTATFAQLAEPGVIGGNFVPSTILVGGTSILTIQFANSGFDPIPAGSIELTISTAYDYYTTDGSTVPDGVGADLFTWSYLANDTWRGTNTNAISAFDGGDVTLQVTGNNASLILEKTTINVQIVSDFASFFNNSGNDNIKIGVLVTTSQLPIELVSFTSKCNNQNVELKWVTSSEINNDYFSIERSIDGINWELVTKVNGAGNSTSIKNYSYTDVSPYQAISYYRLKQTDFDGEFKYSAIIAIEKCKGEINGLAIYPNPVIETLNLSYKGDKSQILSTSIYNLLGELVYYSELYQSRIVFEDKLNGIYFLHLNTSSKNSIKKFIVID